MTTTTEAPSSPRHVRRPSRHHSGLNRFLFKHELDAYPSNGARTGFLALSVLATIVLYYTYYTQSGVTPNVLRFFHMTFAFYVAIVIVSNAIGAFASLPASKTDRIGRSNLVIYGLLAVGILVAFVLPNCTTEWEFLIANCVLGLVEGAILVATPALVRDFSPQVGRASAMGFWTIGPVAGSLLVSVVANHTLAHFGDWQSQFIISGVTALVVFGICLALLKDLSPRLRDQLMVSTRDRALVEARARGLSDADVLAATEHPWRQILSSDLVFSALGIAVFLLVYYAAAGFFTIYWSTTFRNPGGAPLSTVQANGLNEWFWGVEIVALILVGWISDRTLVRKPFMLGGAIAAIGFLIGFLSLASHPYTSHTTLVLVSIGLAVSLSVAYAPWMAGFTETVEAKNPALVATGLALWGWLLRLVVAVSFLFLPLVVSSVNAVVDNTPYATPAITSFLAHHADSVAFADAHGPLLKAIAVHQAVVDQLAANPSPANIAAAERALGPTNFDQLVQYSASIERLIVPYEAQLAYLSAHASQLGNLQSAVAKSPSQWQHWYWVCIGGMLLFLPTIVLIKGRWRRRSALQDKRAHEELVHAQLAAMASMTPA